MNYKIYFKIIPFFLIAQILVSGCEQHNKNEIAMQNTTIEF